MRVVFIFLIFHLLVNSLSADIYLVGPGQDHAKPSDVMGIVSAGDTVYIEAGEYKGDVGVWRKDNLYIKGINGRPHLIADGKYAMGKGIWVLTGNNITVENIEFSGAKVPDHNGAGIRLDGSGLTCRNCYFHHNENGILAGRVDPESNILIEHCIFAHSGYGEGYSHNLYIHRANSLIFRYNYSHNSKVGHLLKTRAANNIIYCNYLSDHEDGNSSYVVDMPNGGISYVLGNILVQGPEAENSNMMTFGSEGLIHPVNRLFVVNNTFVNNRHNGYFGFIKEGTETAKFINNIFAGNASKEEELIMGSKENLELISNLRVPSSMMNVFVDPENEDFHLNGNNPEMFEGVDPGYENGTRLLPYHEYVPVAESKIRYIWGLPDVGAFEYDEGSNVFKSQSHFRIYPNPCIDDLIIEFEEDLALPVAIKIFTIEGKLVEEEAIYENRDQIKISLSDLEAGMYVVEINADYLKATSKILIKI